MINSCFDIGTQAATYYTNTFAPFIEIDPQTLKCSITADKQFFCQSV